MEKLLKNNLMIVSGWGGGLAFLFVFFHGQLALAPHFLAIADNLMAVLSVTFFLSLIQSIAMGMALLDGQDSATARNSHLGRVLVGSLLGVAIGLVGVFFLEFVPGVYGETRTTVVLGALLAASGVMVAYAGVAQLLKRRF